MYALYAFCRHTDDIGDESVGNRLELLDFWESQLELCYTGIPAHPILLALKDTITLFGIPKILFAKIIEANRMDQGLVRFETYQDLLHYCDHSANPVGRMVMHVLGSSKESDLKLSDHICTALQLTNFWQDITLDLEKGRIYLPQEDMEKFGYSEAQLIHKKLTQGFRELMHFEIERTVTLFEAGRPLLNEIHGRIKLDITLFIKGGMSILKSIRNADYDVLNSRPTVTRVRKAWLMTSTAFKLIALNRT